MCSFRLAACLEGRSDQATHRHLRLRLEFGSLHDYSRSISAEIRKIMRSNKVYSL